MNQLVNIANASFGADEKFIVHDIDTEVPSGLPQPKLWKLYLMPVRQRRITKGGILLTDDYMDAQSWNHQLYKVAAVGPQVYKGPAYSGYEISQSEIPKVGDLVLINPKMPQRFTFKGVNFVVANDDQLLGSVDPATVEHFKFYGFEL